METFTYADGKFLLNGKPFTVISGAIHYFRVHPDYWKDRLKKLKACGNRITKTFKSPIPTRSSPFFFFIQQKKEFVSNLKV